MMLIVVLEKYDIETLSNFWDLLTRDIVGLLSLGFITSFFTGVYSLFCL